MAKATEIKTVRVKAKQRGFHNCVLREPGHIFDVPENILPGMDWVEKIAANTPKTDVKGEPTKEELAEQAQGQA